MIALLILAIWIFTFIDIHYYYKCDLAYRKRFLYPNRWYDLPGGGLYAYWEWKKFKKKYPNWQ